MRHDGLSNRLPCCLILYLTVFTFDSVIQIFVCRHSLLCSSHFVFRFSFLSFALQNATCEFVKKICCCCVFFFFWCCVSSRFLRIFAGSCVKRLQCIEIFLSMLNAVRKVLCHGHAMTVIWLQKCMSFGESVYFFESHKSVKHSRGMFWIW